MANRVKPDKLQAAVDEILRGYSEDVYLGVVEATKTVINDGKKQIKAMSRTMFKKRTGDYAKGWTSQVETGRLSAQGVIYNAKVPGLPHLLEHGHVGSNGKRTFDFVQGKEHIAKVEQEIEKNIEEKIRRKIEV